jgi:hypothetical protein
LRLYQNSKTLKFRKIFKEFIIENKKAVFIKKPSQRVSGHGSLECLHSKESEPESGSGDFLAGEINHDFLRDTVFFLSNGIKFYFGTASSDYRLYSSS